MLPFKGYTGWMQWDADAQIFHGEASGLRAVITFQGQTEGAAAQAFRDSVEDYLDWRAESGKMPETPASDELVLHVPPDLHRQVALAAQKAGVTLDEWAISTLSQGVAPEMTR